MLSLVTQRVLKIVRHKSFIQRTSLVEENGLLYVYGASLDSCISITQVDPLLLSH